MYKSAFITCVIFVICKASPISDIIDQCELKDSDCLITKYLNIVETAQHNGIPEMKIPPLEPYKVRNITVNLLGLVKVSLIEGSTTAFTKCIPQSISFDLPKRRASVEIICENASIEGHYKAETTQVLDILLERKLNIHGKGRGNIVFEKIRATLDVAFGLKRLHGGELHFEVHPSESSYTYEIMDKINIDGNSLYIGNHDITDLVFNIINENWEFIGKIFARPLIDEVLNVFYKLANTFFKHVPAKNLVKLDDLSHV